MKTWNKPDVEILEVKQTAFGPYSPETPDSDKTQITKPDGKVGWVQEFGEGVASL